MAVTSNTYTVGGSGQAGPYSYGFPIIDAADVKVSVDGQIKTVTTHYTVDTANTRITFVSGQEPSTGAKVIVYRSTDEDPINATFVSGSTIRSNELNDNFKQLLYITQEVENQSMSTLGGTMANNFTLGKGADLVFEGSTEDANETTVTVADPTADRTITIPNVTGTVVTTGDTGTVATAMYADNSVTEAKVANNAVGVDQLATNTVNAGHIQTDAVTAVKIMDGNVTGAKIAGDAIDQSKIADDAVKSEHIIDNAVGVAQLASNTVNAGHIQTDAITAVKIMDGNVTSAKIAGDAIDGTKIADNAVAAEHIVANAVGTSEIADNAVTADQIAANAVGTSELASNSVNVGHITDSAVTAVKILDGNVTSAKIAGDAIDASKIADNAVGTEHIADAELTTLAGMPSDTASILASSTALTSTTAELNLLDGKSIVTSVGGSSTDVQLPTAKAVNDQILALTQAQGGFYPIADELKFPNTNPDPGDDAGTIVSIADAGGIVVNGSGVSTTARTLGGSTVTINGIDSSLHNTTIAAGKGMLVQTTSTLNTYDYHRLVVDEAGVASAQTLVNDFNDRYQIASSAPTQHPDGSALQDGDLWFDTSANVMKVYDLGNTSYAAVTSVGDYKLLTVVPDGATSGNPVFNASNKSFDLRDGSSAANITSAGQLLVVLNGVLQKPNAGSYSASEEGFYLEGTNGLKFCTAPFDDSTLFVTLIGSATSVNVPADNSVATAKIQNLAVATDKIADQAVTLAKLPHGDGSSNGKYLRSNNGADPTWETVSQYSTPLTTRGDLLYRDASGDQRLAKGTAGQYLKIGANDPEWADVVGAVADGCIFENDQTISNNYTIASGKGAHSVGPITVNATVTVNGNWVVS